MMLIKVAGCFLLYAVCCKTTTVSAQSGNPAVSAEMLLNAFCRLPNKIDVMKCVSDKTDGKALDPWNKCLNSQNQLSKEDQISLSCKSQLPQYALVNGILTSCVDSMIDPQEASTWMPIMEQCGKEAAAAASSTTSTKA